MFLQLAVEMYTTDAYILTQLLHAVFVVVDVRHDGVVDSLEEFLFCAVHADGTVVVTDFGATHLVANGFAHAQHLVEGTAKKLQVERLRQEVVGLERDGLELRILVVFACEDDDIDVVRVGILFDASAELVAVAIRHDEVGNNHVGTMGEE